jgi:hypothetical protein
VAQSPSAAAFDLRRTRAVLIRCCTGRKNDGTRCGSPAVRGKRFCYYHDPATRDRRALAARDAHREIFLPDFRDPRTMLAWAMQNLAAGRISSKAAGQLIYAAQQLML